MKKSTTAFVSIIMLLSLFPAHIIADAPESQSTIMLSRRPKTKDHNQNLDDDGQRAPSIKIPIYISEDNEIYSPSFDASDVISYNILNTTEDIIFSSTDQYDFANFIHSYQEPIWIQIEFSEYYIEGWYN